MPESFKLDLPAVGSFSLAECLVYLNRSADEPLHRVTDGRVYKLLTLMGQSILLEIGQSDSQLELTTLNGRLSDQDWAVVWDYVRQWFDLDRDLAPFYRLASDDPILQPLTARYNGLRLIGIPDLFEALCWSIIGQQINLRFAYTLKRRFVEKYGASLVFQDQTYWTFPTPETVAGLNPEDLRPMQFSGRKAEYLIGLARLAAEGRLVKDNLLALGDSETIHQALIELRGVGRWTADYVLMKCFRRLTAFPIDDVGLHNALKQALNWSRKPTVAEISQIFSPWRGWEAYATFYLWHTLVAA